MVNVANVANKVNTENGATIAESGAQSSTSLIEGHDARCGNSQRRGTRRLDRSFPVHQIMAAEPSLEPPRHRQIALRRIEIGRDITILALHDETRG